MKQLIKWIKGIVFLAGVIFLIWVFYCFAPFLPLDFSQDYLKVQGIEDIVFEKNGQEQFYKRCLWGLKKIGTIQSNHQEQYSESDGSIDELMNYIDTDYEIRRSIYSPDKKYILYCEIEYDYSNSGMTDDEYCYYRVYEIETGKIITIYQAYRGWYYLYWNAEKTGEGS